MIKYADPVIYDIYAPAINESFTTQQYIPSIGEGFLTPLPKPGKPKGPCPSLRPLTLLNGSRKMLSLVILKRIEQKIDDYTMAWQSGYKQGRSCSDIVWAQRMMISVVMRKRWSFSKMGIDMSSRPYWEWRAIALARLGARLPLPRSAICRTPQSGKSEFFLRYDSFTGNLFYLVSVVLFPLFKVDVFN